MVEDPLKIIWLASYPKSGNTWLRFFLAHLIYKDLSESSDVSSSIPEIGGGHDRMKSPESEFTLVKTHLTYSDKLPMFDKTHGFIYIVRHPLDVLLSNLNYHMLKLIDDFKCTKEEYIMYHYYYPYLNGQGDDYWKQFGYGSWTENVSSWLSATSNHPCLILRYEDMLSNPIATAETMNSFLNLNKTREQIIESLNFSSFDNMKKIEENEIKKKQEGFFSTEYIEKGYSKGYRFMNKGKSNQKHKIPPFQRKQFMAIFQQLRTILAYY